MTTKILIVDDHPIAQKGIVSVINTDTDLEICGILGRANDVMPFVKTSAPDVIILDLNLPDGNGADILAELIGAYDLTVIIMTGEANAKNISLCLNLGVRGIVCKCDKGQNVITAIHKALTGDLYLSPNITKKMGDAEAPKIKLSSRQMAILHFMGIGTTNKEICYRLKIAPPTVSFHTGEIRKKLNVSNNKKILPRAIELDLI